MKPHDQRKPIPAALVAKLKAAYNEGIPAKVLAKRTGVDINTIRRWGCRTGPRQDVAPDPAFVSQFEALFRG